MPPRATTPVSSLEVSVFSVKLEAPESEGTLTWGATTVVVAEAVSEVTRGLGFTYGTGACATLIRDVLVPEVVGLDALEVPRALWDL